MISQRRNRRSILKSAGVVAALAALRVPAPARAATDEYGAAIVGSWIVAITYADGAQRTRGLATFSADGTFMGSISAFESAPAKPTPSRGTTLHGAWANTGGHHYALTAVRLHLTAQGILLGVMTTKLALTLDASLDSWSGTFTFNAAHPSGAVYRSDTGTVRATRIGVQTV